MSEYDISRAFKRIENDLIDSMMRNLKRHQVEEAELGKEWEQWQAIQLAELEEYRKNNAQLFKGDFSDIQEKIDDMFWATYEDAQSAEEHRLMDRIKKGDFRPTEDKGAFFRLNEGKLQALLMATKADFTRAEYAMLRRAEDQYRKIIFDSMTYANITNDYGKAVDMATADFLKRGINCIQYKGWTDKNGKYHRGAMHDMSDYASMALRTGNKRAYLMGEGDAHDRYGLHTIRVNRRTQACPKCVGFLGRLLIDDVYGGGTRAEATAKGIPTLSDAMQAGFLHPNCKDIYSVYIEGVSQPAKPWTQNEISEIVGEYNQEQEIKHAEDMKASYERMAKYSLDPENQQRYQARANDWQARIDELQNTPVVPVAPPTSPTVDTPFTDAEKEALEYYVSGDGMWVNNYLRGIQTEGAILPEVLDAEDQQILDALTSATNRTIEADKLYRSVDAKVIFSDLSEDELYQMTQHLLYGNYDNGAYSQSIKRRMEQALTDAKGKEITEKGFMSTTVDKQVAVDWQGFTGAENPVVIEFDTKGKKLKGADLDFLDVEDDPQRERLLAKNTRYKIKDISVATDDDGMRYIKVNAEIIDQAEELADAIVEDVAEEVAEQVIEQPTAFVPAKTIKEAEEYARSLGFEASYKGVELEMANAMNESFKRGLDFCPSIRERMQMVGSGQERNKVLKQALTDYYLNNSTSLQNARALGYSDKQIENLAKKWASKSVGRVGSNVLAFASDTTTTGIDEIKRFSGIFVNNKYANYALMAKEAEENVKIKFHPVGTDSVKAIFDHEMGHQLDYALGLRKHPDIVKLYRGMSKAEIKDNLSEYANENIKEFIAEAYSEYLNNPQPREVARQVGEIIERLADEQR